MIKHLSAPPLFSASSAGNRRFKCKHFHLVVEMQAHNMRVPFKWWMEFGQQPFFIIIIIALHSLYTFASFLRWSRMSWQRKHSYWQLCATSAFPCPLVLHQTKLHLSLLPPQNHFRVRVRVRVILLCMYVYWNSLVYVCIYIYIDWFCNVLLARNKTLQALVNVHIW